MKRIVINRDDELWLVRFMAYVIDEQQMRQLFWSVAVSVVEEDRTMRIGDEKSAVAAFKELGKRWLSVETIRDESEFEAGRFHRETDFASRQGGFFDSPKDVGAEYVD